MYSLVHWKMYDYDNLRIKQAVSKKYDYREEKFLRYSDFIIMVDTETSKSQPDSYILVNKGGRQVKQWLSHKNYVVAFSISIRYKHENLVTLYGNRPDECIDCIDNLIKTIYGDKVFLFIFNMSYDYCFLRKFMYKKWGTPTKQLNIDPYYPISIEFGKAVFRDAYILAQRKLGKWAEDYGVAHQKTDGWDYDRIRTQDELFDIDELSYIEGDTLAGVECIDKLLGEIGCRLMDIPFTGTGIARREAYKIGKSKNAKKLFNKLVLSYEQYIKFQLAFHGGYSHCNRFIRNHIYNDVICLDEASAYPFAACSEKYPMTRFEDLLGYYTPDEILETHDKYAYLMKVTMVNVRLKNEFEQMPVLQYSKNLAVLSKEDRRSLKIDNGRILQISLYEAYITDIDLELIYSQYDTDYFIISDVMRSEYGYLPRWFTDHVYKLYEDKCKLKGGDPVKYDITKMKLNSVAYGMIAMRNIKEEIIEDYDTGKYTISDKMTPQEIYDKFIHNRRNIYPYQWCCWITAYALKNLHTIGHLCEEGTWLYSDTDSCFSNSWNWEKVEAYNKSVEEKLHLNGYEPIKVGDRIFHLGAIEIDKRCDEFKALHSKCYAYMSKGEMNITIAGVPKKTGKKILKSLDDFEENYCFPGEKTNKKTHVYHFVDEIFKENGIIYGDSIDLIPCDYSIKGSRIDNIIDYQDQIPEVVNNMFTKSIYSRVAKYE